MTSTSITDELLAVIAAAPDDDEVRLVYADHLQSLGDPRGEFIRLQVDRAAGNALNPGALRAERELLRTYERKWSQELGIHPLAATFERGFVSEAVVAGAHVAAAGARLFAARPQPRWSIEGLSVNDMLAIARMPELACVRSLSLREDRDGEAIVRALTASPHVHGLRTLGLSLHRLPAASIRVLARANIPALAELHLDRNELRADAIAALESFGDLTSLHLAGNSIKDEGASALAAAPTLAALGRLVLFINHIGPEGAAAIARSPQLSRLRDLELGGNAIGSAGAEIARMRGLRRLSLLGAGIDDASARALVDRDDDLDALDLRGHTFSPAVREALVRRYDSRVRLDPPPAPRRRLAART